MIVGPGGGTVSRALRRLLIAFHLPCVRVQETSEVVEAEGACEALEALDAEAGFAAFHSHEVSGVKASASRCLAE